MKSESFEDLEVYRHAARLSDEIHGCVQTWNSIDQWTSGVQMIRAADAICADLAEALGRGTRPDQARFLFMARGSTYELQNGLSRATARGLPMLNGLIRSFGRSPPHDRS